MARKGPLVGRVASYTINGVEHFGIISRHDQNPGEDYVTLEFPTKCVPPPLYNFVYATLSEPCFRLYPVAS